MRSFKYAAVAATLFLIASCSNTVKEETDSEAEKKSVKVYPVKVEKIKYRDIERTREYTASLVAFKEIHYAPASPGRIDKINVEVGSRVTKGQVLVEIDKTQLNQALTQLATAKSSFQRIDTLYQLGSASEQQHEQVKTQYELTQSNVDFLKENTVLLSPINGIVTGKYFENGEMYSGAPNTPAGKAAVISLMQINPLKALVSIPESFFPVIKEGMIAKITVDVYPGKEFKGKISQVYPVIDNSTRTFQSEIIIDNEKEILRPGMFARIHLKLREEKILAVPSIAVLKQEGTNQKYVFVNDNDMAVRINVNTGDRFDDLIELKMNGIREGMELIVEGQGNLKDGVSLKVVTESH
ncbi:MAG: efflux RND transporter periplasmic adaptor subunit [Bacteroidales bacterium]|nr:efflux RND transporter periplasmic adaptor subunit [Bacteroidales bacterium]